MFYVQDATWGGLVAGTKQLSPTSRAMVEVSDEIIAIGGGEVARDELQAAVGQGRKVQIFPADMNHRIAIDRAAKKGQRADRFQGRCGRGVPLESWSGAVIEPAGVRPPDGRRVIANPRLFISHSSDDNPVATTLPALPRSGARAGRRDLLRDREWPLGQSATLRRRFFCRIVVPLNACLCD